MEILALNEFLENWKIQAKEFYKTVKKDYTETSKNYKELFPEVLQK